MKYLTIMLLSLGLLKAELSQIVIDSTDNLIIDVYADWCGPCKKFSPIFEAVSKDSNMKEYRFEKANIDTDKLVAKQFKVSSVPTVLFIKKGKEVGREVGYMSKDTFASKITQHFGNL